MVAEVEIETSVPNPNTSSRLKVEGDLGALQIEELSDSDQEQTVLSSNVGSTSLSKSVPPGLVQSAPAPVFGSVAITNSDNVQFGNNTFFNGPVTIKQIVKNSSGIENASYTKNEDDDLPYNSQTNKLNQCIAEPTRKYILNLQKWHILALIAIFAIVIGGTCAVILTNQLNSDNKEDEITEDSNIQMVKVSYNLSLQLVLVYLILVLIFPIIPMAYAILLRKIRHIHNTLFAYQDGDLLIASEHLRIVSREDWLAQPVEKPLDPIRQPIPWVIITHTAGYSCTTQNQCVKRVRLIQQFHVESNYWFDIGYNFLVGGDGSVYWGRGWDYMGAHTKGYNKYSVGIAFIGTFTNDPPPKQQVEACQKLIAIGVKSGKLSKHYKLFAHRQLMSTQSPGDKVFDLMKEWPHFVKNVSDASLLPPDY